MKKFYLIAAMALMTLAASAQQTLNISTYNGTNLARYDGQEYNVVVNRYMFTGWNTIALPFSVTEDELNETFGSDCQLEKLVAVEANGNTLNLYFQDCKAGGIEANTPYIIHYTGEIGNRRIAKTATVTDAEAALTVIAKGNGEMVTMEGAREHTPGEGLYGILAADNSEAHFVAVDDTKSGFYASRCFIKVASGNTSELNTIHLGANEVTSIASIASSNKKVDVYTLSGIRVATGISPKQMNKLQPGVYVVNGQKVLVK
ncbi:MAG: hypothetical protein IKH88_07675 [Prevotella sp.]|nr:hypothetical protein [Prevotella sp.]